MTDPYSSLIKMLSSLLIVLALIVFVAYIAKRFLRSGLSRWRAAPLIQVLSTAYLGPKREISIIEVGKEFLVVGITPNQISLITRLDRSQLSSDLQEQSKDIVRT